MLFVPGRGRRRLPRAVLAATMLALAGSGCRPAAGDGAVAVDLLAKRPRSVQAETRRVTLSWAPAGDLLSGWAWPEWNARLRTQIVWAVAQDTEVAVRLLEVRDLQFLVKMAPLDTVPSPQTVAVAVNGHPIASFALAPTLREYRFVAPADVLKRGRNVLAFHHASLAQPLDSRDTRHLAAAYTSILTGPACGPLRPRGLPPTPSVHLRRKEGHTAELRTIGPVEFLYRVKVPPGGRLDVVAERTGRSAAATLWRATVRASRDDPWTDLGGARLARPWLGSRLRDHTQLDLAAWAGRSVLLRIAVAPEACRAATGELVFTTLAVRTIDKAPTPSG